MSTPRASGLQLNLSKDIIERTVMNILNNQKARRAEEDRRNEVNCSKAFDIASKLVMTAKEPHTFEHIPENFNIERCSQYAEFKKIMGEHNIAVSNQYPLSRDSSMVEYVVFENNLRLIFHSGF